MQPRPNSPIRAVIEERLRESEEPSRDEPPSVNGPQDFGLSADGEPERHVPAQPPESRVASGPYRFETMAQMAAEPIERDWIIKGIFARRETSAWIAPPGGMKSALLAQASVHAASALGWHGHRSCEACGVVYFALERSDLVKRRLKAHEARLSLPGLPIAVVGQIIDPRQPLRIQATIEEAARAMGVSVGLVIFDTFAKLIAAAGGDESSAKDQGIVFTHLQRIKDATNTHIALIGHTGKDESRGWRGSNASLGDVDLEATVSGDVVRTVTVTKRNDGAEGPLFSFTSEIHDFGLDRDGEPLTVNVVSHEDVATVPSGRRAGAKISPRNAKALAALQNVLAGDQVTILPGNRRAAHRDHWQAECILLGLIDSAAKPHSARTMFARFRADLFSANRIAIEDDWQWLI
jgi:hypothetical protein